MSRNSLYYRGYVRLPALIVLGSILLCGGVAHGQLMGSDSPPEVLAVFDGMRTLEPYVRGGGRFTGQKNSYGQTAGMMAAMNDAETIKFFAKAGGRFTEERDKRGRNAAFYAIDDAGEHTQNHLERPRAIEAFILAGGRFDDVPDGSGETQAMLAVRYPQNIPGFLKGGGRFGAEPGKEGYTAAFEAVWFGAASIEAFSKAGGVFTSHQAYDQTAGEAAAKKGGEALAAYDAAVKRQGGLVYVSSDDEFSALRNAGRVESFVKAGGHFDDRYDKSGYTAATMARSRGAAVFRAFAENGGRFTTQLDPQGNSLGPVDPHSNEEMAVIFRDAVRRQGGLITLMPADEYEAARVGAPAITMFAKAGGRFTERPDENDMTSAMLAVVSGPEAIAAYTKATGRFSDWQNGKGYTAAIVAVIRGPEAIAAFSQAGGTFTGQQDHHGMTAALWAVSRNDVGWPNARMELHFPSNRLGGGLMNEGSAAIKAFAAAGGRFDDHQDNGGVTAAMLAIENGPEAIAAFAAAGGRFTEQEDKAGRSAEEYAAFRSAGTIRAFSAAGGRFTDHVGAKGTSSEMTVAQTDEPAMITAYSECGGLFTDRTYAGGWTSEMLASNMSGWMAERTAEMSKRPATAEIRKMWKERFGQRDLDAARAYRDAVARQGGLRHVPR